VSGGCKHPGCPITKVKAAGYCNAHYLRQQRGNDMDAPMRVRYATDDDRFWVKVSKTEACWVWTASLNDEGYGQFGFQGRTHRAHRLAYAWANGPIPAGMEIDHICHNRACVNPAHLRPATSGQNGQNLQGAYSNSASGVRGVSWYKTRGTWRTDAKVGGKRYFLGYFDDLKEAESVVTEWRRAHMPYSLMDQEKAV